MNLPEFLVGDNRDSRGRFLSANSLLPKIGFPAEPGNFSEYQNRELLGDAGDLLSVQPERDRTISHSPQESELKLGRK